MGIPYVFEIIFYYRVPFCDTYEKQRSVTLGVGSSVADVQRICSTLQVEPRDLWLVDSGATCSLVREFVSYREEPWGKSEIVQREL